MCTKLRTLELNIRIIISNRFGMRPIQQKMQTPSTDSNKIDGRRDALRAILSPLFFIAAGHRTQR